MASRLDEAGSLPTCREVVHVFREGESLIVRARRESDLSEYFDSVSVDVDPEAFRDYHKLSKALLKGV